MRPSPLILAACFTLACAVDTTEPRRLPIHQQSASTQAAQDMPNVVRFGSEYFFGITDTETDLIAFAGLPEDPKNWWGCGGNEPLQTLDFQYVGLLQDAIKGLMKDGDVNLIVYKFSTYEGFCWSSPVAHGKGRVTYVDNNVFFAPVTHGDDFGWRMEGPVTLAAGGTANLMAHNRWQALPNGTFRRIFRQVRLSSQ